MSEIRPTFDPDGYWWRRVEDFTRVATEFWDGNVAVSHADLGGTLDIVASLRTTEGLLTDLIDVPGEVERVLWQCSETWRHCYDRLADLIAARCRGTATWSKVWSQRRTYMLQCDFCYMISPAAFGRFVLPELTAVCDTLDDAFFHLDGVGSLTHLDALLGIESLKGIQWVPGAGQPLPGEWPDVLRRIRDAGKLCQVITTADDAMKIVREMGGTGFHIVLWEEPTPDQADTFVRQIQREHQAYRKRG